MSTKPTGALTDLQVLDLTGRKGGYCGLLLANLGATVVLVEPPGGDLLRREGPYKDDAPHEDGSLAFAAYHANKRGIVIDLEAEAGRDALRALARSADVLIEDKPVGYLDEIGVGYAALSLLNPALVMTSISGFGQSGPYRDFKTSSIVAFAMGGLMNLCGHPGRPPLMGPCDVAYHLGSVHAALGTLVALFNRRATGRGEHVDLSLQDVLAADPFLRIITRYSVTGEIPERTGHSQTTTVAETYECKDGFARIFINQPDHWRRFLAWLGNPPELMDPELENVAKRTSLRPLIDRLVEAQTMNYETAAFFDEFQSKRLAAAPIYAPGAFLVDSQTRHRTFVVEVDHDYLGRHKVPGDPYKFSASPCCIERSAPRLGQHQHEVTEALSRRSPWLAECAGEGRGSVPGKRAFEGIRVISFPTGIVGPALASLMAEHGAEVIAIEAGRAMRSPHHGRRWQLAMDLESNHSKKRIAINMKHPEGLELAKQLIAKSDVVAENFSARVMASWELDYAHVREVREDIIMASLQGFGQTGPRREFVSFGPTLMAFSGMTYLWRDPDIERPGAGCQTAFPDFVAPSYGAVAILAALLYRERTGKGQYIDVSQAETAAAMLGPAHLEYLINGREPEPRGNLNLYAAPHGAYRCKGDDRWCAIAVETQADWIKFCDIVDHREWSEDPRFSDRAARVANRRELDSLVETWTIRHTPHQVMIILQRAGVAAGIVQTAEDLYRDPHLREREFTREVYHSQAGWVTRAGPSVRVGDNPFAPSGAAHRAGDDNEAVCGELLGLSKEKISALVERGALR